MSIERADHGRGQRRAAFDEDRRHVEAELLEEALLVGIVQRARGHRETRHRPTRTLVSCCGAAVVATRAAQGDRQCQAFHAKLPSSILVIPTNAGTISSPLPACGRERQRTIAREDGTFALLCAVGWRLSPSDRSSWRALNLDPLRMREREQRRCPQVHSPIYPAHDSSAFILSWLSCLTS